MIEAWHIVMLILMLLFSALFSGTEIAFVSINKLKIELKSAQDDKVGNRLSFFIKNTPRIITTILIGNNLALVLYGIYFAKVLNAVFITYGILDPTTSSFSALIIQTLVSTLIILFLGEYLPKAIFRLKADQIMFNNITTRFLQFFYFIFGPLVSLINGLSRFMLLRILRLEYEEEELVFGKEDLNHYIRESAAATGEDPGQLEIDTELFENAMDFNEVKVREFMVPRTEIEAIPLETSLEDLIDIFQDTGHSKILIYGESFDQMLGFVHSTTLFRRPENIQAVIQPLMTVPESMTADVLFAEFTKHRRTIALVVDEFGGTSGLVTVEDMVEEVFGEIEDEHDEPDEDELHAEQVDEKTWIMSARNDVDNVNEAFDLGLPEGDYTTLGGLIIHYAEAIPKEKDEILIGDYNFVILEATATKVDRVKIVRL